MRSGRKSRLHFKPIPAPHLRNTSFQRLHEPQVHMRTIGAESYDGPLDKKRRFPLTPNPEAEPLLAWIGYPSAGYRMNESHDPGVRVLGFRFAILDVRRCRKRSSPNAEKDGRAKPDGLWGAFGSCLRQLALQAESQRRWRHFNLRRVN